jgi:hypothetical protein
VLLEASLGEALFQRGESDMKKLRFETGFAIFIMFFGIALLDAFWSRRWTTVALWLIIGTAFFIADNLRPSSEHRRP